MVNNGEPQLGQAQRQRGNPVVPRITAQADGLGDVSLGMFPAMSPYLYEQYDENEGPSVATAPATAARAGSLRFTTAPAISGHDRRASG